MGEYAEEDVGNIVSFEHINVQIPDQSMATLFYVVGMGFTRDPYLNVGLNNMWVNVGEQQFHLPTRSPQVIDGHIGVVVPNLDALEGRLKNISEGLKGSKFVFSRSEDEISVTCPWGNRYRCFESRPAFGDMMLGIPYVEFRVASGTASAIVGFYRDALGAPGDLTSDASGPVGRVSIGRHQALLFREAAEAPAPYDGHHVAIYVSNFSGPYAYLKARGLISEEVRNHQFRFKDIVDPDNGAKKFTLEHEVRSLKHPMYHRPFVNRDAGQSQRSYHRGWDALVPFER